MNQKQDPHETNKQSLGNSFAFLRECYMKIIQCSDGPYIPLRLPDELLRKRDMRIREIRMVMVSLHNDEVSTASLI